MNKRLPPLNALRAFEVAARHLSFSKAAEELHVTPAAISQQIKILENDLGVMLFRRINRGLLLTDNGQLLLPDLNAGFDKLHHAVETVRQNQRYRPLTVTLTPSFASQWLIPRLERFWQKHPTIEVRIDATLRLVDFLHEETDMGIRYTDEKDSKDLVMIPLAEEAIIPVCSPNLLQTKHPLTTLADLHHHTLLHSTPYADERTWSNWRYWFRAIEAEEMLPLAEKGPQFSLFNMAIQAAIAGQGVALVSSLLVADDLAAGRLVQPIPLQAVGTHKHYLVYPQQSVGNRRIEAFQNWLLEEAAGK